jgi:replicative DNA helicase
MKARIPPHDLAAERSVLGAIMLDPEAIIQVAEKLKPESFYEPVHQIIYGVMSELFEQRTPIDAVTVTNSLKKKKELSKVGGASMIAELTNAVSSASNITHYAKLVAESALRRNMITTSSFMNEKAYDETTPIQEIIDAIEQSVFGLSQQQASKAFIPIKDTLAESFERLDELQKSGSDLRGLATGFNDLDVILAGLHKSNLIILAARPGTGKTAFALNISRYISVELKKKVGFFSLEMSKEELVDRLLVAQSDIDAWRLKTGRLDQQDFLKLSDGMGVLAEAQIFIDDTPGLSISEMRTKSRRLMLEHQIDFLVVDYLQLAHGRTRDNRVQEVGEISQGLKNIARELCIPVLALSQLSRAVESRGEKIPQLSDLRESGCITGDTLVTLASGAEVPIKELMGKTNIQVMSLNQKTHILDRVAVSNIFSTGKKQVYILKTRLGREIRATANHKFLTIGGWKRLDQLKIGEHLALPRNIVPQSQSQTMSNEEVALLAHLIGDGCTLPNHVIQYTTTQEDLAQMVTELARKVFGNKISPRISQERSWYQVYLSSTRKPTHGVGSPVSDWLKKLQVWGLRSYQKKVPDALFIQPSSVIAHFLKHLWVTDGCIKMTRGKKPRPVIYYATSSRKLASQTQSLLLRLGIKSRMKNVPQLGKGRDQYHVIVSSISDIKQFAQTIGTLGSYKKQSLEQILAYIELKKTNTNVDIIPKSVWTIYIKPIMKQKMVTQRQLCDLIGTARSGAMFSQNISRDRLMRIAQVLHSEELKIIAQSDIFWDEIISVIPDTIEEVFDMTVPAHANFVANNIVIHNSIEQDADVVLFLYRKDDDNRESVNLKIAKHRNGAIGDVELYFRGERMKFYGMESKR